MSSNRKSRKKAAERRRISQYWFIIKELTGREIKRKYSRSVLGVVWSVLHPLLFMIVISLIFSQMFQHSIENFPVYYLSGYILWSMFSSITNESLRTFFDNRNMLIKAKVPLQIFVLAKAYLGLVNLGYSLIPYVAMLFVFRIQLSWTILFFPVIIFFMLLFAIGISYILATTYVFFGDIQHLYSVLLTLWMFCSALFYPADMLTGLSFTVVSNNPIFNYIDSLRAIVMNGTLPSTEIILRMVIWGLGMYIIGNMVFKKNKNRIMQKA